MALRKVDYKSGEFNKRIGEIVRKNYMWKILKKSVRGKDGAR